MYIIMRRWSHFLTNSFWRRPATTFLPRDPLTFQVNINQLGQDIDKSKDIDNSKGHGKDNGKI